PPATTGPAWTYLPSSASSTGSTPPWARDRCSAPPTARPATYPAATRAITPRWPGLAPAAGSRSPTLPQAAGPSTPSSATRRTAPGWPATRPPTTPCGGTGCPRLILHSEDPVGPVQRHWLAGPITDDCPRCGWHGYFHHHLATIDGDWTRAVCDD